MRKSRVESSVVSNDRGLTCAMQDALCSNIPHLFLYEAHFC